MTKQDLSKQFIHLWQTAKWDHIKDLLSESVSLKIAGIDTLIVGKKNVCNTILASKYSINQTSKIEKVIGDNDNVILQLETIRGKRFWGVPFNKEWEEEARDKSILKDNSCFRTALIFKWINGEIVEITSYETIVLPPDIISEVFINIF